MLKAWVEQGADYQTNWSLVPPKYPATPPLNAVVLAAQLLESHLEGSADPEVVASTAARDEPPHGTDVPHVTGTVVVSEDHLASRQTLAKILRRMGYRVLEASHGRDALALVRQERPLAILRDVNMPVMDGIEATLAVRTDPLLHDVPILPDRRRFRDQPAPDRRGRRQRLHREARHLGRPQEGARRPAAAPAALMHHPPLREPSMKSSTDDPNPTARSSGADAMKLRLSIDRFEGKTKEIAVLLADDGTTIDFPKRLLPKNARAGDILALTIERNEAATKQVTDATRKVQDELKKTDPGGDIKL